MIYMQVYACVAKFNIMQTSKNRRIGNFHITKEKCDVIFDL